MKIYPYTRDRILADYAAWEGADKKQFVSHEAHLFGVSPATVYRLLPNRRRRKGGPKTYIGDDVMKTVLATYAQMDMAPGHFSDVWMANTGEVLPSVTTIRRRIKQETGLNRKRIRKMISPIRVRSLDCIRMRAKEPNAVWQLDFTGSAQYYIDTDGAVAEYSDLTHSKNKKDKTECRLWLYGLVDDYSSLAFAFFYPGLSSSNAVDFLIRAMARKGPEILADQPGAPMWLRNGCAPPEDSTGAGLDWFNPASFPLCGVPAKILTDNDVVLKGEETLFKQSYEKLLGGEVIHHLPGHSNVKGKVENLFSILSESQKVTRLGRFKSLYEANVALMGDLIRLNIKRQSFARWSTGIGKLRMLDQPNLIRRLFLRRINVRIDDQVSFTHNGTRVYLPREEHFRNLVEETIDIFLPANYEHGDEMMILINGHEIWTAAIDPIVVNTGEQYHALPKTRMQEVVENALAADLSGLQLTGIYHKLPQYRQEYAVPVGESYRPETLQPVKGPSRSLLWAARTFQEEGLFTKPVTSVEMAWLKQALFNNREEAAEAEILEFMRDVKQGRFNVGDKVAMFAAR